MTQKDTGVVFRILSQIVESNPGLLVDHKRDFTVHDKAVIDRASPGQRFLWCLRQMGTQLFPLDGSHDPIWITYYIQGSGRDKAARFYVLDFGPDTVTEIEPGKALRLANGHGITGKGDCKPVLTSVYHKLQNTTR